MFVSQDGEDLTLRLEQAVELTGRVEPSGLFEASMRFFSTQVGMDIDLEMFGQFGDFDRREQLRATLIAFGLSGDVLCGSLLNYDLVRDP